MLDTEVAAPSRVIEDTFILDDQAYVYTDQNWRDAPGVADAAFKETRRAFWKYWGSLLTHRTVIEDGRPLPPTEVKDRVLELSGGLFALAPFVTADMLAIVRRSVNGLVFVTTGVVLHDLA